MLGLVVRILVLCALVFGVAYALVYARKAAANSKEATRIADEIQALRAAVEQQSITAKDYAETAARIRRDCERLGIPAPELPPHYSKKDSAN